MCLHRGDEGMKRMHQAKHVGIHDSTKHGMVGLFLGQGANADAGCADDDVGCTDFVEKSLRGCLHRRCIAHVGNIGSGVEAGCRLQQRVGAASDQTEAGPHRAVVISQRRTQAGTGAGNENPQRRIQESDRDAAATPGPISSQRVLRAP